jgi:nuclear pore complex protein Nup160
LVFGIEHLALVLAKQRSICITMSNTYLPLQLVYAHLPCPPSIPSGIPELRVPSSRPFPQSAEVFADPLHPDHAQSSAYDPATGILARSIHNDYVLELRTLSSSISVSRQGDAPGSETVRIFFPDPLRPLVDSSITLSRQDGRLYILVVTQENVVYRLSFPVGGFKRDSGRRFAFTTRGDDWSEEYEVPEEVIAACGAVSAWHVVDSETVVLGGTDGGIIRLARSDQRGDGEFHFDAECWSIS